MAELPPVGAAAFPPIALARVRSGASATALPRTCAGVGPCPEWTLGVLGNAATIVSGLAMIFNGHLVAMTMGGAFSMVSAMVLVELARMAEALPSAFDRILARLADRPVILRPSTAQPLPNTGLTRSGLALLVLNEARMSRLIPV